ncbi:hypothetical protein [Moraxella lacunata]|uniref:hypothetical protein n=1 Tax=Moraxella lacunata TaxID=477 RepID=UPI003EDFCD49
MQVFALTLGDDVVRGTSDRFIKKVIIDMLACFDDRRLTVFGHHTHFINGFIGIIGFYNHGFHRYFLFRLVSKDSDHTTVLLATLSGVIRCDGT